MEYQRQLHLQRLTEQEAEMQARINQQRLYTQLREQQNQVGVLKVLDFALLVFFLNKIGLKMKIEFFQCSPLYEKKRVIEHHI